MAYIKNSKPAAVQVQLDFFAGTVVEEAVAKLVPPALVTRV